MGDAVKVFLQYEMSDCGKSAFLKRLIPAMKKHGIEISNHISGASAAFMVTRDRERICKIPNGMPSLIRMDGINLLDTKKNRWRIKAKIKPGMKRADVIVYQSAFAKKMLSKITGIKKDSVVIFNGACASEFDINPVKSQYKHNIIMSAKWYDRNYRGNKRLVEMLNIAGMVRRINKDIGFWVAGEMGDVKCDMDGITPLGRLPRSELNAYLKKADAMLNIGYYDWCPNAVVEALCAGVPVICSNQGGVPELVQSNGVILNLDENIKPKMMTTATPPAINHTTVVDAVLKVMKKPIKVSCPYLDINEIARQYAGTLKGLV